MDDSAAIQQIIELAVETHQELDSIRKALGKETPSKEEMDEAKYFDVVDRRIHSSDDNEKVIAFLRLWLEDYVGIKAQPLLAKKE